MRKRILLFIFLILIIQSVSAIKITEVESNPAGTDSGNEWVELYSDSEVNLSDYKLINNDGDEILINISFSGYYVYTFNAQWLDNTDEKVFLYKNDELIDETDLFKDDKNNDLTWQLCDLWEFLVGTGGETNDCVIESEVEDDEDEYEDDDNDEEINETTTETTSIPDYEEISNGKKQQPIILEPIILNPKVIKSEDDSENSDKSASNYAIYSFVVFCVLLGFLFLIKKIKAGKNEFKD